MNHPNQDPSLTQPQPVLPSGEILLAGSNQLEIFEIPEREERNLRTPYEKVAVDNADGFSRLVSGGLDALEDGETVTFASMSDHNRVSAFRTVFRTGDSFGGTVDGSFEAISEAKVVAPDPSASIYKPPLAASAKEIHEFFDGVNTNPGYLNYTGELIKRGDNLGDAAKAMGYSETGDTYPLPSVLQNNIKRMREEGGVMLPNIRIFEAGAVPGEDYVGSWADGEFPVSGELGWFSHDAAQDHMRALMVFGDDAMGFGQLYAQAVQESESIVGLRFPDQYEINKAVPQKIEFTVSGPKKFEHAAYCLDQFTSELDSLVHSLDNEPFSDDVSTGPQHMDYLGEMARVIMDSPKHREQFLGFLEATGSKALESGQFSYDTFAREALARAQANWAITPRKAVAAQPSKAIFD